MNAGGTDGSIHDRAMREAQAGRIDAAISMVRLHLRMRPKDLDALNLLGSLLLDAGQVDQALAQFQRLLAAAPDWVPFLNNHANALMQAGKPREAIVQWERALALQPGYLPAWVALSSAHVETHETLRAIDAGRRAVALNPALPAAAANLAFALSRAGEVEEAVTVLERVVQANPADLQLRSGLLMLLNYMPWPAKTVLEHHQAFGAAAGQPARAARTPADPDRALRVGILSGDLHEHSVGHFAPALVAHRTEGLRFEAFSSGTPRPGDPRAAALRARFEAWHECATMTPDALDAAIRAAGIDVLIELGGHTDSGRLTALVGKPAPVIISAIGYPNTTGLPAIDWRLVDAITDPPGSEHLCTERLLRLDPCFLCYSPPEGAPEPALPPPEAPITFGSFNNAAKIGPATVELWASVLRSVPGSRLLLKSQTLSDAAGRARIERRLVDAGIEASRVELIAYSSTRNDHLSLYHRVHVALDTTPYNGTTTTCEALWMGVPVITMLGDRHAARVSSSLLRAAGHPELVAHDPEDFARRATDLSRDRARLAALRAGLRTRLASSTLCDATTYATRFHQAIRASWRQWCADAGR